LLVDMIAYANDGVIEGKHTYLVETGTDAPLFVFKRENKNYYTFAILEDYKTGLPFSVTFPNTTTLDLLFMNFFSYNKQTYACTNGKLFKIIKDQPEAVEIPINLEHLAGIYGSPKQILLAVYNKEGGLDIVQMP